MKKIAVLLFFILLLFGCSASEEPSVSIATVTDIHYAGSDLCAYCGTFAAENDINGSGKQMRYLDEITDAFIEQIKEEKPDYLLITGDITFIGAKASHEAIIEKLYTLLESGISVLVLPGNHDIVNYSYIFPDGEPVECETVTPEEFPVLYKDFGFEKAIARDPSSLSYVYDTEKGIRIFMLDTNITYGTAYGQVKKETFSWLKEQLALCRESGDTPLVAGHHNLLTHNEQFILGYRISNSADMKELLEEYGADLYLSGHMHAQHIAREDNVTDIAGGSFAVYPHHYGMITMDQNSWQYEAKTTDVAGYAEKTGLSDKNLLNYDTYGFDFFYQNAYRQAEGSLSSVVTDPEKLKSLCDLSAKANVYYFGGTLSLLDRTYQDEFIALSSGTRWGNYISRILLDTEDAVACASAKDSSPETA